MLNNKMQIYSVPTLSIKKFDCEDIVTASQDEENLGGISLTWKGFEFGGYEEQ